MDRVTHIVLCTLGLGWSLFLLILVGGTVVLLTWKLIAFAWS